MSSAPHLAIRKVLPVLWHDEFDELEDVVRLAMAIDVPVAPPYRDDIVAYVTGLWALAEASRGERSVGEDELNSIRDQVASALNRLWKSGVDELASTVLAGLPKDVWQVPDEPTARGLLKEH